MIIPGHLIVVQVPIVSKARKEQPFYILNAVNQQA